MARRTNLFSRDRAAALLAACLFVGCGNDRAPTAPTPSAPSTPREASPGAATTTSAPSAKAKALERPGRPLTIAEARRYMLALVNRDRASQGLGPVALDEGAPTVAGQQHAEDMVRLGYLGHWGSDGSVPEQRYTEAGGADMVLENALCFTDEKKRTVDGDALIDPEAVERAESQFFDEVPPNDGHRRNILRPLHTRVGIGVAQSTSTAKELAVPCFTHEFVDDYGAYAPLPARAKPGQVIHVEGVLTGARPTGVGVAHVALPAAIPVRELNKRRSYPVPKPSHTYWGPGFVTPIVAQITGSKIAIDVPLSDGRGLYEISVWAKVGASDEQSMVSLRTVRVE